MFSVESSELTKVEEIFSMSVSFIVMSTATDRYRHSRRDSLSTVSSSVAAEIIRQNELNSMRNNIRVGRYQTLHIGDVYNNIFRSANSTNSDSVQLQVPDKDEDKKTFKRRKLLIGAVVMLIMLGVTAGAVYFVIGTNSIEDRAIEYVPHEKWFRVEMKTLTWPIKRIIVGHTANEGCYDEVECKLKILQMFMNYQNLSDIPYNFLIGGDGTVFEGRGFCYEGDHTSNSNGSSYNDIGIGVFFIGTFETVQPSNEQIEAFSKFIKQSVSKEVIVEDYKIFFHDHLTKPIIPADALLEVLTKINGFHSSKFLSLFQSINF